MLKIASSNASALIVKWHLGKWLLLFTKEWLVDPDAVLGSGEQVDASRRLRTCRQGSLSV